MRSISLLSGAALTALSLCVNAARAEEEAIVVTATRAPTPAASLPVRVEIIERGDIEALGLDTLATAIGPDAVQSGGPGQQTSAFLRGSNSNHVLALLDGVRLNDASTPAGAYDFGEDTLGALSRVEVLRGPASSIYGADAIGGVVNMIPRRGGTRPFEPFLEAAAGSFDSHRVLAGAAGSSAGFDYGLSVENYDTAGFDQTPSRFALHSGERDGASIQTAMLSARQDLGDFGVDALFRVRHSRAAYDTFSGGPTFDLRADDPQLGNDMTQSVWRLGGDARLGPASVRLSGGQVRSDRSETDAGLETNSASSRQSFADLNARLVWDSSNLTAGIAYERDDIDTRPQFAEPLSIAEDQTAAYIIGQSTFFGRATATGSVRVDHYQSFGTQATYQLGLAADFDRLRLFASHGAAFKAPSLSERFERSFFNHGNRDLKPETSRSSEIGADWRVGPRLTLGASYYRTRIDDLIEYDFAALQNINIGAANIDGDEIYAQWANTWASLRVRYDWLRARNADTGEPLLRRPENSWRLDAQVRPTSRLSLALQWSYVGARRDVVYDNVGAFVSASAPVSAFSLAAISATFDLDARAQLFGRIDNVADERYEQPSAFAGAPRSLTVGLRARY